MNAQTFNTKGEPGEKFSLSVKVFGITAPENIMAQAVRVYLSNQRKAHAKTKNRSEVVMTTAKMYKQKGTGRARHGSYSAPVFVGGAIAHGPRGKQNYEMKMPEKMKRMALLGTLTQKAKSLIVITGKSSGKTKEAENFIKIAKLEGKTVLIVASKGDKELIQAWKNLHKVTILQPNQLNTYAVIKPTQLIMTEEAVAEIEKIYAH